VRPREGCWQAFPPTLAKNKIDQQFLQYPETPKEYGKQDSFQDFLSRFTIVGSSSYGQSMAQPGGAPAKKVKLVLGEARTHDLQIS
jgi:hypothetical protein